MMLMMLQLDIRNINTCCTKILCTFLMTVHSVKFDDVVLEVFQKVLLVVGVPDVKDLSVFLPQRIKHPLNIYYNLVLWTKFNI